MPYIDDYKDYLRGKTVAEMGNAPLDVDNMTEDQLSTAMGYMLLQADNPTAENRPFIPTQEAYNKVVENYNQAVRDTPKVRAKFNRAYDQYKNFSVENNLTPAVIAYEIGKNNMQPFMNEGTFTTTFSEKECQDKEGAIDYLVGMYQKSARHDLDKDLVKEGGYLATPGPKFTDKEKELLKEKAQLHANPPKEPAWWKKPLRAIGKLFGGSPFKDEFESYERLEKNKKELAEAHRDAATQLRRPDHIAKAPQEKKPEMKEQGKQVQQPVQSEEKVVQQVKEPKKEAWEEYLDKWANSAKEVKNFTEDKKGYQKVFQLGNFANAAIERIRASLAPGGKGFFSDQTMQESIDLLGVYQLYGNPIDIDKKSPDAPLREDHPITSLLEEPEGVLDVMKKVKSYRENNQGAVQTLDDLKVKLEKNEPIFSENEIKTILNGLENEKTQEFQNVYKKELHKQQGGKQQGVKQV